MSLAVLYSRALSGMDAAQVTVEVHLANGLPRLGVGPGDVVAGFEFDSHR